MQINLSLWVYSWNSMPNIWHQVFTGKLLHIKCAHFMRIISLPLVGFYLKEKLAVFLETCKSTHKLIYSKLKWKFCLIYKIFQCILPNYNWFYYNTPVCKAVLLCIVSYSKIVFIFHVARVSTNRSHLNLVYQKCFHLNHINWCRSM